MCFIVFNLIAGKTPDGMNFDNTPERRGIYFEKLGFS